MTDAIDELEVPGENGHWTDHLRRKEQDFVERVIHGVETGHYFMILGCKVPLYLPSPSPHRLSLSTLTPRRGPERRP